MSMSCAEIQQITILSQGVIIPKHCYLDLQVCEDMAFRDLGQVEYYSNRYLSQTKHPLFEHFSVLI